MFVSIINKIKDFFGFVEEAAPLVDNKNMLDKAPQIKSFRGSLINNQNTRRFAASEIKIEEPRIYEDSLTIATYLRESVPVIVNLKYLDASAGKRLIDFVCGTAYAINGHMMKIGENIFLFTPANMLIVESEEKSTFEQGVEQEEKEVFFRKTSIL